MTVHDRHDEALLDAVAFDADGLGPGDRAGGAHGDGPHGRLGEPRGARADAGDQAAHFWSRSRKALWRKGESSGNTLAVREVRIDCDGDVVLYLVDADGPSCHTGATSCFYRRVGDDGALVEDDGPPDPPALVVARVADVIAERRRERPEKSYVVSLLDAGLPKINGKIAEESRRADRGAARERRRAHRARGGRSDLPHAGRPGGGRRADRRRVRRAARRFGDLGHRRKSEPQEDDERIVVARRDPTRGSTQTSDACWDRAARRPRFSRATRRAPASWRWPNASPTPSTATSACWSRRAPAPGKTLAYLVPALLSGRKVVVSTGTKTLQDQIATVDLPRLRDDVRSRRRSARAARVGGDEGARQLRLPAAARRARPAASAGRRSRARAHPGLRRVVGDRRPRRPRRAGRRRARSGARSRPRPRRASARAAPSSRAAS